MVTGRTFDDVYLHTSTSTTEGNMATKERFTTLTRKGQITIPIEFRRALGLKEGDRISVVMEDSRVQIAPSGSIAQRTAGIFKTNRPPTSAEDERRLAEEAIAQGAIERMGG